MQNSIKSKITIFFCVVCIFLIGTAVPALAAGTLTIAVSSGTVRTGDTVTVTVYAENANGEEVTADMNISYDASKLEYVSSSATGATGGGGTVKASGSGIDIKFKAIGSGDAYVKAEGATLTAAGAHINVSGTQTETVSEEGGTKSGDNSLSSLALSQGTLSPSFKGSVTAYTAEVGSDVNEITVTPVTSNSKATVESITGNKDLKPGVNVITVVVKAENGTTASYKITVTKKETPTTSSGNAGASNIAGSAAEEAIGGSDSSETPTVSDPDAIVIGGVNYKISQDFTEEEIPEGFSKADFEYKGNAYQGIMFDQGYLGMYYLVNDAGEGKFFIYDANRDKFYPYVRLSSGEHFIILITVPNGVIPPDNYKEIELTLKENVTVPAYQYTGGEDKEIVKIDTEEESAAIIDSADFYLFYGMDTTGVTCWYQYDTLQGTYQRFNEEALSAPDVPEDYEELSKSYQELKDKQKDTRVKNRRTIAILIFVMVVLVVIIINILLKFRDFREEEEEYEEEKPDRKVRFKRKEINTRSARKEVKAKAVKKPEFEKKRHLKTEEWEEESDFYDKDDDDIIDEFEENPGVLRKKPVKKAQKAIREEDDDLEFLDLDDL